MTNLYPRSFLSLKKGIRYDLLAAESLYRVTRAGVQELLVSYKIEKRRGHQFFRVTDRDLNKGKVSLPLSQMWALVLCGIWHQPIDSPLARRHKLWAVWGVLQLSPIHRTSPCTEKAMVCSSYRENSLCRCAGRGVPGFSLGAVSCILPELHLKVFLPWP